MKIKLAKEKIRKPINKNENLHIAKVYQNDEFYTQLTDIEKEMYHYWEHFEGKTIYCNCDDPRVSNFVKYFAHRFELLKLKKLISTCYMNQDWDIFSTRECEKGIKIIYNGETIDNYPDFDKMIKKNLKGDGDFRSKECIELLKEADIVVTNPPFSLFREFVAQLMEYDKKFIILGNMNAVTYKEIFPLIKENKIWWGVASCNKDMYFDIPEHYQERLQRESIEGSGYKIIDGVVKGRLASAVWYTNLPHKRRKEKLNNLWAWYAKRGEGKNPLYPKYDNYDAIEVSKVAEIPADYEGVMGVPVSFLDKYNPEQFEILGSADDRDYYVPIFGKYDGRITVNGIQPYKRIFIKHKHPENYEKWYREITKDFIKWDD